MLRHPKIAARGCVSDGGLGDHSETALRILAAGYRSGLKGVITGLGAVSKRVPPLADFSENLNDCLEKFVIYGYCLVSTL